MINKEFQNDFATMFVSYDLLLYFLYWNNTTKDEFKLLISVKDFFGWWNYCRLITTYLKIENSVSWNRSNSFKGRNGKYVGSFHSLNVPQIVALWQILYRNKLFKKEMGVYASKFIVHGKNQGAAIIAVSNLARNTIKHTY